MARKIGRLNALSVSRAKLPGMYPDGGGLYLQVTGAGARSWLYRYMLHGRAREMGLGPLHAVSLSDARAKAAECRGLRIAGIDPIDARKSEREAARLEAARTITFKAAGEAYIATHRHGWRNAKHSDQWTSTLETYAYSAFGSLSVQEVGVAHVLKAIEPIWTTKTETANRVRGRIEAILDWAKARGYRQGDNPARWRGHLDNLLPARSKVRRVEHHPALRYTAVGTFMASLREQPGISARALEFVVVTTARTGETIGARWSEFDLDQALWTIPAARMKAGKEHRVPLSAPALAILKQMEAERSGEYVFPGAKRGRPLSNMALLAVLRRMGRRDLTVHGFRSSFKDWSAEQTNYAREVSEMCLAHTIGDAVERAYRRGDLLERRRRLMDEWARYCGTPKPETEVIPIRAAG